MLHFIGTSLHGLREFLHQETGMVLVSLPGGKFSMGSQQWNMIVGSTRGARDIDPLDP
jgi:hypothetical protein